jgi:hypothetical protein
MPERNLAVGSALGSVLFALLRAIALLVPLGYTLSHWGAA